MLVWNKNIFKWWHYFDHTNTNTIRFCYILKKMRKKLFKDVIYYPVSGNNEQLFSDAIGAFPTAISLFSVQKLHMLSSA